MNSTKSKFAIFRRPLPAWYHYVIYFPLFTMSIVVNVTMMVWYKKYTKPILGKRATFQYIMKILTITDILTALIGIIESMTFFFYNNLQNTVQNIITSIKNTIYIAELFIFIVLAIDRVFAIVRPFASWWNRKTVFTIFYIYIFGVQVLLEVVFQTYHSLTVKRQTSLIFLYIMYYYYVLTFLSFGILDILTYGAIAIIFGWHSKNQTSVNEKERIRHVVKLSLISFQTSIVYILCLIPTIIVLFRPDMAINRSVGYIAYLHCITNVLIFSLNNRFIKRKVLCCENVVGPVERSLK